MQTITKTYDLYTFEELDQKAKDKARAKFNESSDEIPFLGDDLREYIHEELKDRGYTVNGVATSANPAIEVYYSLSYCQGDGLMFEASLTEDKTGNIYTIKHAGHYYHERSTSITGEDKDGNELREEDITAFNDQVYIPICKTVRDRGYSEIEYNQSEENFAELCAGNEYTFLADGTMMNE